VLATWAGSDWSVKISAWDRDDDPPEIYIVRPQRKPDLYVCSECGAEASSKMVLAWMMANIKGRADLVCSNCETSTVVCRAPTGEDAKQSITLGTLPNARGDCEGM